MYWGIKYTHSNRSSFLSMEYRSDNCKYYGEPNFNNNLFSNGNKCWWLFTNVFGNCFSRHLIECYCNRITIIDLCRSFININS